MKVAVTGPICKDIIYIDDVVVREGVGGGSYYESRALKMLGAGVKVFGTYAEKDDGLVKKSFKGINLEPIYVESTITHELYYKRENPDIRETRVPEYGPNAFPVNDKLLKELRTFDYIFFGPLYYENLP